MRLSDISWVKAEEYFKEHDTVMIAVGSIECHGRHMPLGTDFLVPEHLLKRIEKKTDVLIAPTVPYGSTLDLASYPGTINVGEDGLYIYLHHVLYELKRHGARHFIILNGHGGNCGVLIRLASELAYEGCLLSVLNWWWLAWDINPAWRGGHGGAEETAAVMAVNPDLVDKSEIGPELKLFPLTDTIVSTGWRSAKYKGVSVDIPRPVSLVTDSGWIGDDHPGNATREWGEEMLAKVADFVADFAEEFPKTPLPCFEKKPSAPSNT